ncbi:MAG: RelA/SpoT family protein [Patescibacteria group bacterium]|nr:RelA/SpoT family protein [Patescibacteria group bacterium]MDE2015332.1 RelA/SpoT family protein [Patescibacteria group bacterium]MDE2227137.1 RelA/SpoT family protein [Patescibacteria group bacterium]
MTIKESIKTNPTGLIARAFRFAENAHKGQKRKSGENYFEHPLAAAEILNRWRMDEATIAAALLHDTVEDTPATLEQVRKEFGDDVAFLVDGVTKLGHIKYRGTQEKIENLRKLIFSISQDLRVVFIKLADRLHNMNTLKALPPQKQKRIAMETDEIYAPIAYRLGMQNLAGELYDLAFPYLHPDKDKWLHTIAVEHFEARRKYLEKIEPEVRKMLKEHDIRLVSIDFRAKRYSSLYQKLLRHDMDIEKIYDLVAMRIIVKTIPECYAVLGLIHEKWPPLPGRIKDYIAMPKPNGYRSLHTTIIGPDEKILEVQIRTEEMHEENEYGIAAHWLYQQARSGEKMRSKKTAEDIRWIEQLKNWLAYIPSQQNEEQGGADSEEFLQSMKIDFFKDRIFAITPRGDVIDLPKGATPIDFAYQIHTDIGNSCVGAKVNNQLVPLSHELRSGDLVEILTQKNKKPSEDWLKFVKTAIARDRVRTALRGKNSFATSVSAPSKTELRITTENRLGIIKDISSVISRSHVNILSFHTPNSPGGSHFSLHKIECATTDKQKIEKLVFKVKQIKGVREISYKLE